jgi:hypothetical protein
MNKALFTLMGLIFLFAFPLFGIQAAEYFIAPGGNDSKGDGSRENPWKSLAKADGYLGPGDTFYCLGGIYTDESDRLVTGSDGTETAPITVRNYPDETPVFRSQPSGNRILEIRHDHWIIEGLRFVHSNPSKKEVSQFMWSHSGASHNIFRNLIVEGIKLTSGDHAGRFSFGTIWRHDSGDHNSWYDNSLSKAGDTNDPHGNSGALMTINGGNYNRVFNNDLSYGVHHILSMAGSFNEYYGNTVTHAMGYGVVLFGAHNIAERNIISGCDEDPLEYVKGPLYFRGSHCIARYNVGYDSEQGGIYHTISGDQNLVYNNVIWNVGNLGIKAAHGSNNQYINNVLGKTMQNVSLCHADSHSAFAPIYQYAGCDNYFHNNWVVAHDQTDWLDDSQCGYYKPPGYDFKKISEMDSTNDKWSGNIVLYSDPYFQNPDAGDFRITDINSSLVDKGRDHAMATGSGSNSTVLTVDNADFFWFSAPSDAGDQIIINADPDRIRTIIAIDYTSNTLTLDLPVTWNHGDSVNVYKSFSDPTTIRFSGSAPDIGAFEHTGTKPSLVGDVNGDGTVNIMDVQACVNHILGKQNWGKTSDVNGDGGVDVIDIQEIVNAMLGIE